MFKAADRIFGWLLILASAGHTAGTVKMLPFLSGIFVWSLGSSLAAGLLGVLNILRAGRPGDKTLAGITAVGTTCWALVALAFGASIANVFDPRAVTHFIISVVLVAFSIRTIRATTMGDGNKRTAYPSPTLSLPSSGLRDHS